MHLNDDSSEPLSLSAPCLLPELSSIRRVCVSSPDFFPAELVFYSPDDNRESGNIRPSGMSKGAGQHIVLHVKRMRHQLPTPALSSGLRDNRLNAYSACEHEKTMLQSRHDQLLGCMKERLSLKQKTSQNALNISPSTLNQTGDHNRLNAEIRKLYLQVEEDIMAQDRGAHCTKQLHSARTILRCMASSEHLFQQILAVPLPGMDSSVLTGVSFGSSQPSEELLNLLDETGNSVQGREDSVTRNETSLAVLALGVIEQDNSK